MKQEFSFPPTDYCPAPLRRVVAQSGAGFAEYSSEALDILREGLRDVAEHGVTGCLHIQDRLVFQVLEGPADVISARLLHLSGSPRYLGLQVRLNERCETRRFRDWEMSYTSNHGLDLRTRLPGWTGPLAEAPVPAVLSFLEEVADLKFGVRMAAGTPQAAARTQATVSA